jgi:plastocyanin/uncharacterized membrane protein
MRSNLSNRWAASNPIVLHQALMRKDHQGPHEYDRKPRSGTPLSTTPLLQARRAMLRAVAVAFLSAVCSGAQNAPPPGGTNHIVVMKQVHFNPPEIIVKRGDTVEWKNDDIFSHTVTAEDGSFDSGLIDPGHSWQMTFTNTRTVAYHCRPHPNMHAMLIVQGASNAAQSTGAMLKWSPPRTPQEFHPILVNFTAALLPLAFLSDVLGRIFRVRSFHHAAWWTVLYAAAITPFTAAAGWWWKLTQGSDLPAKLITVHQWLGTASVVLFVILATWRWRIHKRDAAPSFSYLTFAAIVVLAVVYQGSLGGKMVFGK